ncbi:MAG: 50S ribosomal protein L17 [Candidatus Ancillula sp.]|jgi:large subunit ribosomal protein L17|nr:50S ribosomal protein L17 [Candidatus Ancillula sp.]
MVTPTKGARLGSSASHEKLILANLCQSLYEHGQIKTTYTRAKRMQPLAERLITIAKKQTLAAHRQILRTLRDKSVVHELMTSIAEQFAEREGGYTRITRTERRQGDQAEMAIIELVSEPLVKKASSKKTKPAAKVTDEPAAPQKTEETAQEEKPVVADEKAPEVAEAEAVVADEKPVETPAEEVVEKAETEDKA